MANTQLYNIHMMLARLTTLFLPHKVKSTQLNYIKHNEVTKPCVSPPPLRLMREGPPQLDSPIRQLSRSLSSTLKHCLFSRLLVLYSFTTSYFWHHKSLSSRYISKEYGNINDGRCLPHFACCYYMY